MAATGCHRDDKWPFDLPSYRPDLENGSSISKKFQDFSRQTLSSETAVRVVSISQTSRDRIHDEIANEQQLNILLEARKTEPGSDFIFINRFLVKTNVPRPSDPNKLRICTDSLQSLCYHYNIAPAFVDTLASYDQPPGRGCPRFTDTVKGVLSFWYLIPVRVQVSCLASGTVHTSRIGMKKQMNPLAYLHLTDPKVDVRGSQIAVYFVYDQKTESSTTLVINFQDGRWSKIIEEPIKRIIECLRNEGTAYGHHPLFAHSVYLTTALKWWNNALQSFNEQLIAYEEILLGEEELATTSDINRALRCILAHLHRYESELKLLHNTVREIRDYHLLFENLPQQEPLQKKSSSSYNPASHVEGFDQIDSQVSTISCFRDEMQHKADNVLALLVDRMQDANDKLLVQNGKAMQQLLEAMQREAELSREQAEQSRALAVAMRKDGVSMKTIALLTVFFLPGTSYAAILAMPFFGQNDWLSDAARVWVWVVLTLPSTILAFVFYLAWSNRESEDVGNS